MQKACLADQTDGQNGRWIKLVEALLSIPRQHMEVILSQRNARKGVIFTGQTHTVCLARHIDRQDGG